MLSLLVEFLMRQARGRAYFISFCTCLDFLLDGHISVQVPMNKWNEAELDSDRISLIRNLKVIRNSKDLDSAAPVKFALTGRSESIYVVIGPLPYILLYDSSSDN